MIRYWASAAMVLWAGAACGGENLIRNPSFEEADSRGAPAAWQVSGNARRVEQTLRRDRGRDGEHCAQLVCSRFTGGTPDAHAMVCQMGVPVRQGKSYRLVLWARAEEIKGDVVEVALSDTANWSNCGLQESFAPTPQWRRYEFVFRATRTCSASTRLQIWFASTGTLWLDDVELVETGRDLYQPGQVFHARVLVLPRAIP